MKVSSQKVWFIFGFLIVGLALVWIVQSGSYPLAVRLLLTALFVAVYSVGAWRGTKAHNRLLTEASKWEHKTPAIIWVLALTIIWAAMLLVADAALWLAFPLIFLQVGVLGTLWGSVAAILTCAAAIAVSLSHPTGSAMTAPLLGTSIALILTWAIMAIAHESRSRRSTLEELVATRQLLAKAERQQLLEDERNRIAGEIHDTIIQDLAAAKLMLRSTLSTENPTAARTLVERSLAAIEGCQIEARHVTEALAPKELIQTTKNQTRLAAAVRSLAGEPVMEGLTVGVEDASFVTELDLAQEAALLRVIQSALANVKEHAGTDRAEVVLSQFSDQDDATLHSTVEIRDQGHGFIGEANPAKGRGRGIQLMRARMEEVNGELNIDTSSAGTTVRATIP